MEYRYLGLSGLQVSPICLGAMMFGGRTSESLSGRIIANARHAGVNFIDTADGYGGGESERIVGKFIRRHRDDCHKERMQCERAARGSGRRARGGGKRENVASWRGRC